MSRVLLIGRGPLPAPRQRHTGFAQLRTAHFLRALQEAGHTVELFPIDEDHVKDLLDRARHRAAAAEVVVSAGPHRPAMVAVQAAGSTPLWVDVPGAPLAELQALVHAPGPAIPAERIAEAHAVARSVLSRADHLSVISQAQSHATLGQLLLLGRATPAPAPVSVVPIAFDFPLARGQPRRIPETGPVVLILSGAFAPWLDDIALARGLERALHAEPRLRVEVTGGGVAGHYTAGFERFQSWAAASAVGTRVRIHEWLPHGELQGILNAAHIGVCLDRPGAEPTLGSRTRVLLFAWCGLHIVASPTTELVTDLVNHDLATALPSEPEALAKTLCTFVTAPPAPERAAAAATHLDRRYAPEQITQPLLDFVRSPQRHPAAEDPIATIAAELEAVRAQLTATHNTVTWRVLSRMHGLLRNR